MYYPGVDEAEIKAIADGDLMLTTYRVKYWQRNRYQAIALRDITYVSFLKKRRYKLLYYGLATTIAITFGLLMLDNNGSGQTGILACSITSAVAFIALFYLFTDNILVIGSAGGSIVAMLSNSDSDISSEFLETVEAAVYNSKVNHLSLLSSASLNNDASLAN